MTLADARLQLGASAVLSLMRAAGRLLAASDAKGCSSEGSVHKRNRASAEFRRVR